MRMYSEELMDMDAENKKALEKFHAEQTDWFTYCQVCGKRREGTLEQLKVPCGH